MGYMDSWSSNYVLFSDRMETIFKFGEGGKLVSCPVLAAHSAGSLDAEALAEVSVQVSLIGPAGWATKISGNSS